MSELREILEQADRTARRVALPSDVFERLILRRHRKRRNQRVATAAFALILAVAAIGVVIRTFGASERPRPAEPPKINGSNISSVGIEWRVPAPGAGNQPVVAGGIVYETPDTWQKKHPAGMIEAIDSSCATGGKTCPPLWAASTPDVLGTPAVANGVVYVVGERYAYAFPALCARGGATCEPIWKARVPGFGRNPDTPPVVVGDVVYFPTSGGGVYAFSTACGSGGSTCRPLRRYPTEGHPISRMTVANGILYTGAEVGHDPKGAGRLYAFPAACPSSSCDPIWVARLPRPVFGLAVSDGELIVGTWGRVSGYQTSCVNAGGCPPLWTGQIQGPAIGLVVSGGTVYVQDQVSGVYAFPDRCGTGGATCQPLWTGLGFFSSGLSSAPPAVANGLVYIGGTDGTVYVFPTSCAGPCRPLRIIDTGGGNKDWIYVGATGDMIFTAGRHSMEGFGLPAT